MNIQLKLLPYSLFLLLLSSATLISPSLGALGKCNPSDYKALMNIKKSLNNPYHLASWVPNTDCCNWYVVECDPNTNRINQLTVFQGNISGQIPSSVGDLPYLETLVFRHLANVTGSIPQSITKLKHLKMLRLSWTNLSGPIPNFLNQLTTLTYLDLSFNQFSGSIPPNLSDLKNLGTLHLDRNKLTGSIPESFGNFAASIYLFLSHNQLSGPIPKSLGDLDSEVLDLSRNILVGDASTLFKPNHTVARTIDLSRNQLEFDLTKVKFPKSLTSLDISHNKIFGGIPEDIIGLDLQLLNVSYNRLCGQIPTGGKLRSFDNTSFFHNRCLCGPPLVGCKQ
ncbi:hypothetical protein MKW98_030273 [Papaver atlanticum]|uniref:Leucine-rich repeat-containing N-terminal plant-type domain-containing protein n=1 Tax=Papaver atlanticum TaxID=357466 RepID=A0AAD4TDS5_9MAGN|nr:hypothetical protein MKW98_030273 [Papaver atlanticum]